MSDVLGWNGLLGFLAGSTFFIVHEWGKLGVIYYTWRLIQSYKIINNPKGSTTQLRKSPRYYFNMLILSLICSVGVILVLLMVA